MKNKSFGYEFDLLTNEQKREELNEMLMEARFQASTNDNSFIQMQIKRIKNELAELEG